MSKVSQEQKPSQKTLLYLLSNGVDVDVLADNGRILATPSTRQYEAPDKTYFDDTYSSRVTLFNVFEALSMTFLPVKVEPVKLILSGPGWAVSHGPRLSSPLRT